MTGHATHPAETAGGASSTARRLSPRWSRLSWSVAVAAWLAAVGGGLWTLWTYENTPGAAAAGAERWPADSRIARVPGRPTLVMLVHPRCPCSRASLGELALLMAAAQNRVVAYALFLQPDGFADDWHRTALWRSAVAIPGVTVLADDDGREVRLFRATTSGHTLVYDGDGGLVFSGGITAARGHAGDNPGRRSAMSFLTAGVVEHRETPVFGCPLLDEAAAADA